MVAGCATRVAAATRQGIAAGDLRFPCKELTMSKAHDTKKSEKKVAIRTPKEKKTAKKLKKEASKRQ